MQEVRKRRGGGSNQEEWRANLFVDGFLALQQKNLAPSLVVDSALNPFFLALVHDRTHEEERASAIEIKELRVGETSANERVRSEAGTAHLGSDASHIVLDDLARVLVVLGSIERGVAVRRRSCEGVRQHSARGSLRSRQRTTSKHIPGAHDGRFAVEHLGSTPVDNALREKSLAAFASENPNVATHHAPGVLLPEPAKGELEVEDLDDTQAGLESDESGENDGVHCEDALAGSCERRRAPGKLTEAAVNKANRIRERRARVREQGEDDLDGREGGTNALGQRSLSHLWEGTHPLSGREKTPRERVAARANSVSSPSQPARTSQREGGSNDPGERSSQGAVPRPVRIVSPLALALLLSPARVTKVRSVNGESGFLDGIEVESD